jgi:predicted dehydrogenase
MTVELEPLRVLILGCGNVAGAFDEGRQYGNHPFTHAGGITRDARFRLAACVEPDKVRRKVFMDTWCVPVGFSSIEKAINSGAKFDVINICSPTRCHAQDLYSALVLQPKLIFCEKPIAPSLADTEHLVAACNKANIPLAVNYTRRWDPSISDLQADMKVGRWGELRSVVGLYNKGILNNGSHMLDLLHLLVGHLEVVKVGKVIHDSSPIDPTVPVWLEGPDRLPIYLACGNAEDYAMFELQFVFSLGVLTMEEGGMFWRERSAVNSETFKGYRTLDGGIRRSGKYPSAMLVALDNIYRSITRGDALASTGESALIVQRICERIKQLVLQ